MEIKAPKVFISYAWESNDLQNWVIKLGTDLRQNGVDAIVDIWYIRPGGDLTGFMESVVRESHRVIIVCTPKYKQKANDREGGVGYETGVITGELYHNQQQDKFIPIIRIGNIDEALPSYIGNRVVIDFSDDAQYTNKLEELLRVLHNAPKYVPPPIGRNPFKKAQLMRQQTSEKTEFSDLKAKWEDENSLFSFERFTSRSNRKYKLYRPNQGHVSNTMMYGVYCNAESEADDSVGLQVLFSLWINRLFAKNKEASLGDMREEVIAEVYRKFRAMIFYDELMGDKTIELTTKAVKDTPEKMIFDDFEIIRSDPFQFNLRGYIRLNADIHSKALQEILRVLFKKYGEKVDNYKIKQEVWFNDAILQRAFSDAKKLLYIDSSTDDSSTLTQGGKEYYEENISQQSE